ncbi:MAG: AtpZ/AtpI family protein [Pseudomonadota bacterium]
MSDPSSSPPPSLDALEAKIAAARARRAPKPTGVAAKGFKGVELAWRMVIDLAAGIAVGLTIGWGLDVLLGTKPLFIIVFVLLGFAAGVRVMLQSAQGLQRGKQTGPGAPADGGIDQGAPSPEKKDG